MKIPSLFKNAGIYTISNVLNRAIPFLLLPVLTRYLTPEDYGITAMFGVLCSIFTPFIGINLHGAVARKYFDPQQGEFSSFVSSVMVIMISAFVILGTIIFIFRDIVGKLFSFPPLWLSCIPLFVLASSIIQILLTIWQVKKRALPYSILMNMRTLLNLSLSLVFVVIFHLGWKGRILGQFITVSLFCCFCFLVMWRSNLFNFTGINKADSKRALRFGLPMIPTSLSWVANHSIDRIFITKMVCLSSTGLYSVGYSFGSIIGLIEDGFNKAFVPWLFGKLGNPLTATKKNIVKYTYVYFFTILLLATAVTLASSLAIKILLPDSFQGSQIYVAWIAFGFAFNGMRKMIVNYIYYAEKTYLSNFIAIPGSFLNIILNYFLIKINGPIGAAQATTCVFLFMFLGQWILSARVYPMPWFFFINR